MKNRKSLEEKLIPLLEKINLNKAQSEEIKQDLQKKHIVKGVTRDLLEDPSTTLKEVDVRILALLTQSVIDKLKISDISIEDHFTKNELKNATQYTSELELKGSPSLLPLVLNDVTYTISSDSYITVMHINQIGDLLESGDIFYNHETQREAKYVKQGSEYIQTPKLNMRAVKSIKEHLLKGTLIQTILVLNAAPGTSDEGDELVYNENDRVLEITPGTRLDVLDGYHRIQGIKQALMENPELEFYFPVMFTNFPTIKAQQYIGQIAMATPISRARAKSLSHSRLADEVVKYLKEQSELKGRIADHERVSHVRNEIVSINTLADTIDEVFEMKRKYDAFEVGEYLSTFFNMLFGIYQDEFIDNVDKYSKDSLINSNIMFAGYVTIASKLFSEKVTITPSIIKSIMNKIDFSRDNKVWKEIKLLDEKGNMNKNSRRRNYLIKYFSDLNIL